MLQVQTVGYGKVRSERRVHLHWPSPTCTSSLTADLEVGQRLRDHEDTLENDAFVDVSANSPMVIPRTKLGTWVEPFLVKYHAPACIPYHHDIHSHHTQSMRQSGINEWK
jgi:hypothetical protein